MSYRHGAFFDEAPTSLVTPVEVDSALPVVVGTAPVHTLPKDTAAPVNEPRLIYTFEDFVSQFGKVPEGEDRHDYTLSEFAEVFIGRYATAPVVCINVFDPAKHVKSIPAENGDGEAQTVADVSSVSPTDIIGGVDTSGKRTGLALVEKVFPLFRKVPGLICAPGFSATPSVGIAIGAACKGISGHFKAMGIVDMPQSIARPEEAPAWVNDNNLTDENLLLFFGTPTYGGAEEYGSVHLAGVIAQRDGENDGIPFWSPSNKRMLCEGLVHNGAELALTPVEAANLNGNGIITGINMIGGLVVWGDQTACYPGVTDVKDASLPVRRMFNWIGNTLVLTAWQKVSNPLRRRLISSVTDTFNLWLNGLAAREYILGGRVTFEAKDNSTLDLMGGKVRFHVYVTPPTAAREILFTLEYDPSYLETLFSDAA